MSNQLKQEVFDIEKIQYIQFVRPGTLTMSNLLPFKTGTSEIQQETLGKGGRIHLIEINIDIGIIKVTYTE